MTTKNFPISLRMDKGFYGIHFHSKFNKIFRIFFSIAVVILNYRKSSKSAFFGRMTKDITVIWYSLRSFYSFKLYKFFNKYSILLFGAKINYLDRLNPISHNIWNLFEEITLNENIIIDFTFVFGCSIIACIWNYAISEVMP